MSSIYYYAFCRLANDYSIKFLVRLIASIYYFIVSDILSSNSLFDYLYYYSNS